MIYLRSALVLVLMLLTSCGVPTTAPDCDDSQLLDLVKDRFIYPRLEIAHYVNGNVYVDPNTDIYDDIVVPLSTNNERTEEQTRQLQIALRAIELAKAHDLEFIGIRRLTQDDISLSCSCQADLYVDGVLAQSNISYSGQFSLDSMVYGSADSLYMDTLVGIVNR